MRKALLIVALSVFASIQAGCMSVTILHDTNAGMLSQSNGGALLLPSDKERLVKTFGEERVETNKTMTFWVWFGVSVDPVFFTGGCLMAASNNGMLVSKAIEAEKMDRVERSCFLAGLVSMEEKHLIKVQSRPYPDHVLIDRIKENILKLKKKMLDLES